MYYHGVLNQLMETCFRSRLWPAISSINQVNVWKVSQKCTCGIRNLNARVTDLQISYRLSTDKETLTKISAVPIATVRLTLACLLM